MSSFLPSLFDLDYTPPRETSKPAAPSGSAGKETAPQPTGLDTTEPVMESNVVETPVAAEVTRTQTESVVPQAPIARQQDVPSAAIEENVNEVMPEATIPVTSVDTLTPEQPVKAAKRGPAKKAEVPVPEDPKGDKQYYTIGEVAELFKVNTSHVRFWTNEFEIKVRTTRKGDRLYTKEHIAEIKTIHHLVKERGFTLSGAKAKLKERKKTEVAAVDLKTSLLQLRSQLAAIRKQLK